MPAMDGCWEERLAGMLCLEMFRIILEIKYCIF